MTTDFEPLDPEIGAPETGAQVLGAQLPTAAASAPIALTAILTPTAERKGAVILLHGMTSTPDEMADVAALLHDKGFDVFVPCLSGHGTSLEELRHTTTETWFADISAEIERVQAMNYTKYFIGGQSFGALLALWGAARYRETIGGVVLLSVPFRFRSCRREVLLSVLSYLPDTILNMLPTVRKQLREKGVFARVRYCYAGHAVGAAARAVYVRRTVQRVLSGLKLPMLLLHDPQDHHLSPNTPNLVRKQAGSQVVFKWFPGGGHQLTDGRLRHVVAEEISEFIERSC